MSSTEAVSTSLAEASTASTASTVAEASTASTASTVGAASTASTAGAARPERAAVDPGILTPLQITPVVTMALNEDAPWGDLTAQTLIPLEARADARLAAREPGVFSGGAIFTAAFTLLDPTVDVRLLVADGDTFEAGATLATVSGPARSVLQSERVALNFVQRLSGIATLTAAYVAETAGTKARIVDTRKTTPGLRVFERHAVRCGGGHNHRFSLSDAVMAKDNHLAVITHDGRRSLTDALLDVRAALSHTTHLEVEVDRLDQIEPVLAAGVDTIMLDNFSLADLRTGVALVAGRAIIEASGGINLGTVRDIAHTGVDVISSGALTHSVRSLDLGLDIALTADATTPDAAKPDAATADAATDAATPDGTP